LQLASGGPSPAKLNKSKSLSKSKGNFSIAKLICAVTTHILKPALISLRHPPIKAALKYASKAFISAAEAFAKPGPHLQPTASAD
jgi:hypothetical protein